MNWKLLKTPEHLLTIDFQVCHVSTFLKSSMRNLIFEYISFFSTIQHIVQLLPKRFFLLFKKPPILRQTKKIVTNWFWQQSPLYSKFSQIYLFFGFNEQKFNVIVCKELSLSLIPPTVKFCCMQGQSFAKLKQMIKVMKFSDQLVSLLQMFLQNLNMHEGFTCSLPSKSLLASIVTHIQVEICTTGISVYYTLSEISNTTSASVISKPSALEF